MLVRYARFLLVLSWAILAATGARADTEQDHAVAIASSLQRVAERLGGLADFAELGSDIPLTSLSPSDALRLRTLLEDSLGAKMDDILSAPAPTFADVQAAISAAGGDVSGVAVVFENVVVALNGADDTLVDVSFDVRATRVLAPPISFSDTDTDLDLGGGQVDLSLALDVMFHFQLDTAVVDTDAAFALVQPLPELSVSTTATGAIGTFPSLLGFASIDVGGMVDLALDIRARFLDPDDDGRLTLGELTNTAFADLTTVGFQPGDMVNISLSLVTDLLPGAAATLTWHDLDMTDGLNDPTINLGELADFRNVSPSDVLSGLASFASMMGVVELISDVPLPFLQKRLSDAYDLAGPLVDFVRQHSESAIVCGTTDDNPPRGIVTELSAGDVFYCQATLLENPFDVHWLSGSNFALESADGDLTTIGVFPTTNAVFRMSAEGRPDVGLEFQNVGDTEARFALRMFLDAEELLARLADAGLSDVAAGDLNYDATTKSLTFRLHKRTTTPALGPVLFDFADRLKGTTNLASLSSTASASAIVNPLDVEFELVFGVILADGIDDDIDRFFVKVSDAPEFQINLATAGDGMIEATVDLSGKIGFVTVSVTGSGPNAFVVGPQDPTAPLLSIDINASGVAVGAETIADAVLITDLLPHISSFIPTENIVLNIGMTGELTAAVELTPGFPVTGTLAIAWPNVGDIDTLDVTADTSFIDKLQCFDTDPSIFGTVTGTDPQADPENDPDILRDVDDGGDATASFLSGQCIGGADDGDACAVAADCAEECRADVLGRSLRNLTDGSRCVITTVVDADTIECTLQGGQDNAFEPGDRYEIEGNPLDLLSIIVDNFDLIVQGIDALTGGAVGSALSTKLPLIGKSPEDVLAFLGDLESALDAIRTGDVEASVICTWAAPAGQAPDNLVGLPPGTEVSCHAVASVEADDLTSVTWSIVDLVPDGLDAGTLGARTTGDSAKPTVGPSPSADATFTITLGGTLGEDFAIEVEYATSGAGTRSGQLPEAKSTLQVLAGVIENKLGLPDGALALELRELPMADGSGTLLQHLVLRLSFGECTEDRGALPTFVNPACQNGARIVANPGLRINLGLDSLEQAGLTGLVGIDADDPNFVLDYAAIAQFDLAIPLDPSFQSAPVVVVDTSHIALDLGVTETSLSLKASAGPLSLDVSGVVKVAAFFSLLPSGIDAIDNNETMEIGAFLSALTATIDGGMRGAAGSPPTPVDCGMLTVPLLFSGLSTGSPANGVTSAQVSSAQGCDADMPNATTCPTTLSADQVTAGASLKNITTGDKCTVTHLDAGALLCLGDPQDRSCTEDADCNSGQTCASGTCTSNCTAAAQCAADEVCVAGACWEPKITFVNGDEFEIIDDDNGSDVPLGGDACSLFDVTVELDGTSVPVGQLGFKAAELENPDDLKDFVGWFAFASADADGLTGALLSERLAFELLFKGLRFLLTQLDTVLEGGGPKLNLPLVGKQLDGGAGVCNSFGESRSAPSGGSGLLAALDDLEAFLLGADTIPALRDAIQMTLFDAICDGDPADCLLKDADGDPLATPEAADVEVMVFCGVDLCADDAALVEVEDIRVKFAMGQGVISSEPGCSGDATMCPPGSANIPFDLGLPGVPLGIEGSLAPKAGWQFKMEFGMSRELGPYLVAGVDGDEAELLVSASVGLGDAGTAFACGDTINFNACSLKGNLSFLAVCLSESDPMGAPTQLALSTSLDITTQRSDGLVGIGALVGGDIGLEVLLEATASADLNFVTGLPGAKAVLPSVFGSFHMAWDIGTVGFNTMDGSRAEFNNAPQTLEFDNLELDVGKFFSGFVKPLTKDIKKATKPLDPIIDTVRAPVPLVSDLSEIVGGPKVTLLTLMELRNGGRIPMIENLIELVEFINELDTTADPSNACIPLGPVGELGSFKVNPKMAQKSASTPDKANKSIQKSKSKKGVTSGSSDFNVVKSKKSISFPFLEDSGQIFGLLMGQDATLMRFDAGDMRATAVLGPFTYCCIPVGPVPVSVFIQGSATLAGRFAMGYDTVGIRRSFARNEFNAGSTALDVLDGIFIDDLDARGCDVPEISLIGEVSAGAGVDLGFAAAGLEGGVRMQVDLNLDDRPEPDGKLRLAEVANKISNPICLFDVSGRLEAFLGAWVRVGLEWFSKTWRFEILNIKLLDFSLACTPPAPMPANVEGGDLVVNVGARKAMRNFALAEDEEEVVVRQLNLAGTSFSVSMFGFIDDYHNVTGVIRINAGDEDDVISLQPGVLRIPPNEVDPVGVCLGGGGEVLGLCQSDDTPCTADEECLGVADVCVTPTERIECIIPFTRRAIIFGGGGNDKITGGRGADELHGGPGDDRVVGGAGDDMIWGDADNDVLSGGSGNDIIYGGGGDDSITGGPDNATVAGTGDIIFGEGGDDDLQGGPGTNTADGPGLSPDGADKIVGGPGNDIIQGFFGDDLLYGDEELDCAMDGIGTGGSDKIDGGPGNDRIFGGNGSDTLGGGEGDDLLCGNGGPDLIEGDDLDPGTSHGDDELHGGSGDDELLGRRGHDVLFGDDGNDALYGNEDADDLIGGNGRDVLFGGSGRDILIGDDGSIAAHDHSHTGDTLLDEISVLAASANGDIVTNCVITLDFHDAPTLLGFGNSDCLFGGDESDFLFGGPGHDRMFGDGVEGQCEVMFGTPHEDYMEGNGGNDVMRGGIDNDVMFGNAGDDEMSGDSGDDRMFGCDHLTTDCGGLSDRDVMRGGMGDDYMEGNADSDEMFGDAGQDDIVGGSTVAGFADAGDIIHGGAGQDVIIGDNGLIDRPLGFAVTTADGAVVRTVTLVDLDCAGGVGGEDTINGNRGADDIFAGCMGDLVHGNDGDDYVEGNGGDDTIYGDAGQDDLIGGTARSVRTISDGGFGDDATALDGRDDGADTIYGGDGTSDLPEDYDVIVGDNATIDRPVGADLQWQVNSFNAAIVRRIRFLDLAEVGGPDVPATARGDDHLFGEGSADLIYGQGGNDFVSGGAGQDYMEGNDGDDELEGNDGADDMVGGTGRINDDGPLGTNGRLDGSDTMRGGAGFDVMAGDNAILARTLLDGAWQANTFNGGIVHDRRILLDVDSVDAGVVSAGDLMFGDEDDDLMYGQGGGDEMHGNDGDDLMEGNGDDDLMFGEADADDMIGGTTEAAVGDLGDEMHGNDAGDVMLGDNGLIARVLDENGQWLIDPNTGGPVRAITLLDIETVDGPIISATSSGNDLMFGGAGRDLMFGQGNTSSDTDADGRSNEDPPDGVDNDHDGREGADSAVFDCQDGMDNDGDGLIDMDDPNCAAAIDEDGPGDEIHGGAGDDYIEGNHGSDWIFGDEGEDNIVGGSSAGDGVIGGGVAPTDLLDGNDVLSGGVDDDVILGDNGTISRPTDASGIWLRLTGFGFDLAVRETTMAHDPEQAGAFGGDFILGDDGHDDLYGQLGDDFIEGGNGEDAIVGDLGLITNRIEDGSRERTIAVNGPFIEDVIYAAGTMYRGVALFSFLDGDGAEGADRIFGGDGRDTLHGCAGDDIINGDGDAVGSIDPVRETDDEDHLFGGDGDDVLWGGRGHDHLWGGHGEDSLDINPRTATRVGVADTPEWFTYGLYDNFQGLDTIYGGWDADAMQADVAFAGPQAADRLLDWVGGYNAYYVCPGAFGEGTITRMGSPALEAFLQDLAEADGALAPATAGTSGFREVGLVFPSERGRNSHPPHVDHPGHFTCEVRESVEVNRNLSKGPTAPNRSRHGLRNADRINRP